LVFSILVDNSSLLDHHFFTLESLVRFRCFLFIFELLNVAFVLYEMESGSFPFWHYLLILIDLFLGDQNFDSSETFVLVHWLLEGLGLELLLMGLQLLLLGK